jgi:hypothetical protein
LERDVANLARRWFIVAPNTTAPEIERETYEVGIANLDGFLLIYLPERGFERRQRACVSFAGRGVWTGIGVNLHN